VDVTARCLIETYWTEDGASKGRVWRNPECTGCALCRPAMNPHDPPGEDAGGEP